jgi:hypothetical protein
MEGGAKARGHRLPDTYSEKQATVMGERNCAHCGQYLPLGSSVVEAYGLTAPLDAPNNIDFELEHARFIDS